MSRTPLIVVLLGTDHHPFDRLTRWAVELAEIDGADWFVQHGSTALPGTLRGARILPWGILNDLLHSADAVVSHGGPGMIMDARNAGHRPIVVPRDPQLGEHVDNHQQLFTARMSQAGLVASASTRDELRAAVDLALGAARSTPTATPQGVDVSRRLATIIDALISTT
ncbi:MAG TPA: glycosyltransferase [Nocardioides sp.]|nr:glycosyltransferase [Nocardioides sp.]